MLLNIIYWSKNDEQKVTGEIQAWAVQVSQGINRKKVFKNVRHEGHLDVSSCNSKQNFTKQEMWLEREGLGKPAVYHNNSIIDTSKGRVRQNPQRNASVRAEMPGFHLVLTDQL